MVFSHCSIAQDIVFPGHESDYYVTKLLEHALSYSPQKHYHLKFNNQGLPKTRVFKMIAANEDIDVIAAGSTLEREKHLLPIKFPILKGLHGWRIPLVAKNHQNIFDTELSLTEFKSFKPGQLHSWSDTKILESNGIIVEKASLYQGLFSMLATNRFDYLPRSLIEIDGELEKFKDLAITKDKNALIHYPTAYYFYVNKERKSLATDILYGLEQSLIDGSFENMFAQYYGHFIERVNQENRKIYRLKNSTLPSDTPFSRQELWLTFNN